MNPVREGAYKFIKLTKPRYVTLIPERIIDCANETYDDPGLFYLPNWKNREGENVYPDEDWSKDDIIDFFFIGNSMNFLFWHLNDNGFERYKVKFGDEEITGSNAMFRGIKDNFDRFKPSGLINNPPFTLKETHNYLRNIPYAKERTNILNELREVFMETGHTKFSDYIGNTRKVFDYGEGLVERVVKDFKSFNDVGFYKGFEFPIYKRAQLLPAMLYERLGQSEFPVDDINELTVFADYQVPKGLESKGLIKYSKGLKHKILNHIIIKKDSLEEYKIRTCTIVASDLYKKEVNKAREENGLEGRINDLNVDGFFWYMGTKNENPFHLTYTTAY